MNNCKTNKLQKVKRAISMKKHDKPTINDLFPVVISSIIEISPGAFLLSFPRGMTFHAGQVIKISLPLENSPRMYSICSGENDLNISILFNVKEDGSLTPPLSKCKAGDTILVSNPFGSFTSDRQPAWWIATGTGIAPYYSMYRSGLGENKTIIHGARFLNQFYFEKELQTNFGERYIRCCSYEKSPGTFSGRITDYLKQLGIIPSGYKYYLCGNGMMVVEVRDLLIAQGIPYTNIISEIYF
jgi:ferredoxin/flavodoxin---NADP+ reductase